MKTSVDTNGLLPCALCGGAATVLHRGKDAGDVRYAVTWVDVACSVCGIQTPAYDGRVPVPADLAAASTIWNRRTT